MPPPPLAPRRTLRLLVDGDGGLRRLSVQAGSVVRCVHVRCMPACMHIHTRVEPSCISGD